MNFEINNAIEILEQTPYVVETLLTRLSSGWTGNNEGKDTWSPYDVVGHFIYGEKTDWIPRMEIILSIHQIKKFQAFDRFAQFEESKGKNLRDLIDEFKTLRAENIRVLKEKKLSQVDLMKTGIHPDFGSVTLKQLLSAWVVHDLEHIAQMARVMSKQYKDEVGPWTKYLPILNK
jgi:hypothetical protein